MNPTSDPQQLKPVRSGVVIFLGVAGKRNHGLARMDTDRILVARVLGSGVVLVIDHGIHGIHGTRVMLFWSLGSGV